MKHIVWFVLVFISMEASAQRPQHFPNLANLSRNFRSPLAQRAALLNLNTTSHSSPNSPENDQSRPSSTVDSPLTNSLLANGPSNIDKRSSNAQQFPENYSIQDGTTPYNLTNDVKNTTRMEQSVDLLGLIVSPPKDNSSIYSTRNDEKGQIIESDIEDEAKSYNNYSEIMNAIKNAPIPWNPTDISNNSLESFRKPLDHNEAQNLMSTSITNAMGPIEPINLSAYLKDDATDQTSQNGNSSNLRPIEKQFTIDGDEIKTIKEVTSTTDDHQQGINSENDSVNLTEDFTSEKSLQYDPPINFHPFNFLALGNFNVHDDESTTVTSPTERMEENIHMESSTSEPSHLGNEAIILPDVPNISHNNINSENDSNNLTEDFTSEKSLQDDPSINFHPFNLLALGSFNVHDAESTTVTPPTEHMEESTHMETSTSEPSHLGNEAIISPDIPNTLGTNEDIKLTSTSLVVDHRNVPSLVSYGNYKEATMLKLTTNTLNYNENDPIQSTVPSYQTDSQDFARTDLVTQSKSIQSDGYPNAVTAYEPDQTETTTSQIRTTDFEATSKITIQTMKSTTNVIQAKELPEFSNNPVGLLDDLPVSVLQFKAAETFFIVTSDDEPKSSINPKSMGGDLPVTTSQHNPAHDDLLTQLATGVDNVQGVLDTICRVASSMGDDINTFF